MRKISDPLQSQRKDLVEEVISPMQEDSIQTTRIGESTGRGDEDRINFIEATETSLTGVVFEQYDISK